MVILTRVSFSCVLIICIKFKLDDLKFSRITLPTYSLIKLSGTYKTVVYCSVNK